MIGMVFKMKMVLRTIFMKTVGGFFAIINHEGYARWIGVNMKGKDIHIYGNPQDMFSTVA